MTDSELMGLALEEARKAAALGEVPVGAVVARNGEVVAAAHNTRETEKNALHHAELLAIDAACKKLGGWRLWECELFVTLEPCPMCAGAIINSRIRRVVYGAADAKAGCCGSVTDLFALPFNHHPMVEQGLRAEEAGVLLQAFFKDLRVRLAARPKWKRPAPPASTGLRSCSSPATAAPRWPHRPTTCCWPPTAPSASWIPIRPPHSSRRPCWSKFCTTCS